MDSSGQLTIVAPQRTRDSSLSQRLRITLASGGKVQRGDLVMALVMFLPAFVVLILLGTYPIINVLTLAFQRRPMFEQGVGTWVGLENFADVVTSKVFWIALGNDVVFTLSTVIIQTVLGMIVALLLHRRFLGRNLFRSLVLFSYVFPVAVTAIIWRFMLSDSVGIIYYAVRTLHLPIPNTWFASPKTAMASVVMVTVWKFFPFMVINFLAALQTIDEDLYEAAKVDGASSLRRFRHITLPMLMPVIAIVMLLRTIWTFNNWEVIALLTSGGPLYSTTTLPILVYGTLFSQFSVGRAAATAFIMTLLLMLAMVFYIRWFLRAEERLA
jgi:multiple sugar transport system permease protein